LRTAGANSHRNGARGDCQRAGMKRGKCKTRSRGAVIEVECRDRSLSAGKSSSLPWGDVAK
jgi:hypothetical protein